MRHRYAALMCESASHVVLHDIAAEKVEAEVLDHAHGTQRDRRDRRSRP